MILNKDALHALKELEADSIDAVITDPPYGYSFMGKDWDKAVPSVETWKECLRVLKPGGWCMVMSAPRSDVQNAMISRLMEAGFRLDFTPIYWTYASGFPKAGNVGKLVDKKLLAHETEIIKKWKADEDKYWSETVQALKDYGIDKYLTDNGFSVSIDELLPDWQRFKVVVFAPQEQVLVGLDDGWDNNAYGGGNAKCATCGKWLISGSPCVCPKEQRKPKTPQAKALDGSYTGFQPKPAVEVIIVAMKPLSEKTYIDQALKNGKGITWLDDCRVPYDSDGDKSSAKPGGKITGGIHRFADQETQKQDLELKANLTGRFPANLLVSDDVLNTHSKYFDLDAWADTLPFLAVPKASKSEKNKGLDGLEDRQSGSFDGNVDLTKARKIGADPDRPNQPTKNHHPTVKPLKLMSYLITLTTREGDVVLDPFVGSGTTVVAAKQLNRKGIGIEREEEYAEIARARIEAAEKVESEDAKQIQLI